MRRVLLGFMILVLAVSLYGRGGRASKQKIVRFDTNRKYYRGWAVQSFKDMPYDSAYTLAKSQAIGDMVSDIRCKVRSMVEMECNIKGKEVEERYRQKVEVFTDGLIDIGEMFEESTYVDSSAKNVYVFVWMDRRKYDAEQRRKLEERKRLVTMAYDRADSLREEGDVAGALRSYLLAYYNVCDKFGGLPVYRERADGVKEELRSAIDQKLSEALRSIEVKPDRKVVYFSVPGGKVEGIVGVRVERDDGVKAVGVPLRVSVVEGKVDLAEKVRTDRDGWAQIRIDNVSVVVDSVDSLRQMQVRHRIKVEVDIFELMNIPEDQAEALLKYKGSVPNCEIVLEKKKAIGVVGLYRRKGKAMALPSGVITKARGVLSKLGYDVVELNEVLGEEPSDVKKYREMGLDYLLIFNIGTKVEGEEGMMTGTVWGGYQLYDVATERVVDSRTIGGVKEFGIDGGSAISTAMGKWLGKMKKALRELKVR